MSKERKELNEEELEKATGGLDNPQNCAYFLPASGKKDSGECKDCFYYHKESGCSIPQK